MLNNKRGRFLTIEGTEGVGKSTNIAFIQRYLLARNIEVLITREPGGTPLAEELREILLAKRDEGFDVTAELLIIFAARAQHLNTVIEPALKKGIWVLSDRFTDATYAYQGYGRGLSLPLIAQLEKCVQGNIQPDKTFLLDIDVRIGLTRAKARAELDRFESEQIEFFERVRAGYLSRVEDSRERYEVINAEQGLNDVQESISQALDRLLENL